MKAITIYRLRSLREKNTYTQEYVASHIHVRQNTYSGYENNRTNIPLDNLIKIARLFQVNIDYLLGLTNNPARYPKPRKCSQS